MILYDISSAFHKCTHRLAKNMSKGEKIDLKDYRSEFHLSLLSLIAEYAVKYRQYGNPVICLDDKSGAVSWRKEIYPMYKSSRKSFRDSQTTFDYADAYVLFNEFLEALKFSGFRIIGVPRCEADDVILVLGELAQQTAEPCMILSPDKDFIQLQTAPNIKQYSWFTNKTIQVEDKGDFESWELEHICLGDKADSVPRIVDFKAFKPGVEQYLNDQGIFMDPYAFSSTKYDPQDFEQFGGVFENESFGKSTLARMIDKAGGLRPLLESDSTLKRNYFRNRQLVLTEGIPTALKEQILNAYHTPNNVEDVKQMVEMLELDASKLPNFWGNKYIESINNLSSWDF